MTPRWEDLNARARGLATHLADAEALDALAEIGELGPLAAEIARRGLAASSEMTGPPSAAAIERALVRRRGARTALVARWAGDRVRHLAVYFLEEDRRSVRALVRGVLAGAPPEERTAGLCPTPGLPSGLLERLAGERDLAGLADRLDSADHPFAPPVRSLADETPADLFRFDLALSRAFAEASRPPRGAGRLRRFRAQSIDLENGWSLLLAGGNGGRPEPEELFLEGGDLLDAGTFAGIFAEPSNQGRRSALAEALEDTFAAPALADPGTPLPRLPRAIHDARVREERRVGRLRPHTAAPLLEYLLRLRGEAMALRRLVWGLALGADAERRRP